MWTVGGQNGECTAGVRFLEKLKGWHRNRHVDRWPCLTMPTSCRRGNFGSTAEHHHQGWKCHQWRWIERGIRRLHGLPVSLGVPESSSVMREAGDDWRTVQDNDGKGVKVFWRTGLLVVRLCVWSWCCGPVGCLAAGSWCLVPAALASFSVVDCLSCFPGLRLLCPLSRERATSQEPIPSPLPGRASLRYTQVLWGVLSRMLNILS